MKRILSLTATAAVVFTTAASAQLLNFPVSVNPAMGRGVAVAALFGTSLNDASKNLSLESITSYGAGARLGLGVINIAAGAVTGIELVSGGDKKTSFGANAEFRAIKGGMLNASIFAGLGSTGDVGTRIPLGIGLAVAPPGGIFSIWAAPYYQIFTPNSSVCSDCTEKDFGVSGGVRLGMPMGIGVGVSLDWVNRADSDGGAPIVLGIAAGWTFGIGG
ncbi:MAG: hypothetical protein V3T56_00140 [Gemmatimonadales bacterium]